MITENFLLKAEVRIDHDPESRWPFSAYVGVGDQRVEHEYLDCFTTYDEAAQAAGVEVAYQLRELHANGTVDLSVRPAVQS